MVSGAPCGGEGGGGKGFSVYHAMMSSHPVPRRGPLGVLGKKNSEQFPGAVLESAFPYQASDVACNSPYEKSYRLDNWHFVDLNAYIEGDGIPATDDLKQAIYDHGPVWVAVHAGPGCHGHHERYGAYDRK